MTTDTQQNDVPSDDAGTERSAPPRSRRGIRSYVQRSARLGPRLQRHWDQYADTYLIDLARDDSAMEVSAKVRLDLAKEFGRTAPVVMEIGSGRGEMLAAACQAHPEWNLLGCEVYRPGVAGLLGRVGRQEATNVRIAHADAMTLLRGAIPTGSLDELWVFFPDPWHKSRHHKRRLINDEFAALAARALRPGGIWRVATDWLDYAGQIAQVIENSPDFDGGLSPRFDLRPLTRFEGKARDEGRSVSDFTAIRR